jgi:chromosome partitioning protein
MLVISTIETQSLVKFACNERMLCLFSVVLSLAIASQKGGVGKTTVAVNLAYAMAQRGWSTVVLDTDPQGSVGMSLSRRAHQQQGFYDAVYSGISVDQLVLPTRLPELRIIAAGKSDPLFEPDTDPAQAAVAVERVFSEISGMGFDLVIADTAAGLSGLTGEVLKQCDYALVPLQAEPLGARSVPVVLRAFGRLKRGGHRLSLAGILLTMTQPESEASRAVEREVREVLPSNFVLPGSIPRDLEFLEASAKGVPLALLGGRPSASALAFDHLAADLEERIGLRRKSTQEGGKEGGYTPLMD